MAIELGLVKDILLYEGGNGGDFNLRADDLDVIIGLSSMVYIALFGGNIEENTIVGNFDEQNQRFDWWGNELFGLDYNSRFEDKLRKVALNSAGLLELEEVAKQDLKPIEQFAEVDVELSLIGPGKLRVEVELTEPNNKSTKVKYIWDNQKNELIEQIEI